MKKTNNKKKKSKTVYIDDGSTIVDMSEFKSYGTRSRGNSGSRSTLKEQFKTYISAVKLMILPMFAVLGIIALAFLLVYFIL